MKLKNLSNYTHQEIQDVMTQAKSYLQVENEEMIKITVVNYQEQSDDEIDGLTHYEVMESKINIELESTIEEMKEQLYNTEKLIKTYKTKKGLLQAMLNDVDFNGSRYRIHTTI